jgi:hypothetical protein
MTKLSEILTGSETWMRGRSHDGAGRRCLIVALWALHGRPLVSEIERAERAVEACGFLIPDGTAWQHPLAAWNDAPERTWEDVARVVEVYDRDRLLEEWRP